MSELRELVDRLTVETRHAVHTDGGPVLVVAAPLLEQLAEAIHPSREAGGGSSGSVGSGAPLDVAALALMCQVKDEALHLSWLARSTPGTTTLRPGLGGDTLSERIRWTAGVLEGRSSEAEMLTTVRGWVRAIERLFDPPRVVALRSRHGESAACPACGLDRTPAFDPDQDAWVEVPAITVTIGVVPHAVCGECGAEWRGPEVTDMALQMGAGPGVASVLDG